MTQKNYVCWKLRQVEIVLSKFGNSIEVWWLHRSITSPHVKCCRSFDNNKSHLLKFWMWRRSKNFSLSAQQRKHVVQLTQKACASIRKRTLHQLRLDFSAGGSWKNLSIKHARALTNGFFLSFGSYLQSELVPIDDRSDRKWQKPNDRKNAFCKSTFMLNGQVVVQAAWRQKQKCDWWNMCFCLFTQTF